MYKDLAVICLHEHLFKEDACILIVKALKSCKTVIKEFLHVDQYNSEKKILKIWFSRWFYTCTTYLHDN